MILQLSFRIHSGQDEHLCFMTNLADGSRANCGFLPCDNARTMSTRQGICVCVVLFSEWAEPVIDDDTGR